MAVQQQQMLPPQYVEDLQKDYGTQLTTRTAAPLDTSLFAPKVAGQDAAQTSAYNLATGQGIGAFQPYLTHRYFKISGRGSTSTSTSSSRCTKRNRTTRSIRAV
jgi:hypothetical protein